MTASAALLSSERRGIISRRGAMAMAMGGLALAGGGCQPVDQHGTVSPLTTAPRDLEALPPLRETAAKKGVYYGSSVGPGWLDTMRNGPDYEPDFSDVFHRECNIVVAEGVTKFNTVHPRPDVWNFDMTDRLLAYADTYGMKMRGHTLVWHAAMPDWAKQALNTRQAGDLMETYIHTLVGRYKGRIMSWDVVNEALRQRKRLFEEGLRDSPWLTAYGPDYIEKAFRLAHEADPAVQLVYNDYDLDTRRAKAAGAIKLLRKLKDKDVPVHAVGLQSHIDVDTDLSQLDGLLRDIKALELDVIITEFDVYESVRESDDARRDALVAGKTREFLDRVLSQVTPKQILTWGLSDRHSWLSSPVWNKWRNPQGLLNRGLPLDVNLRRKLMWGVLHDTLSRM